jgi:rhodanese-related sulfurtransferase
LPPDCEISCRDYLLQYENNESDESSSAFHIILDVRSSHQFSLTHLKLSNCVIVSDSSDLSRLPVPTQSDQKNSFNKILINLPLSILKSPGQLQQIKEYLVKVESSIFPLTDQKQDQKIRVFALCRRGIDSTVATRYLLENNINCQNISGGLTAWKETVDSNFPMY